MTTPAYDVGDQRRLIGTFVDVNNAPIDPTAITLTIREPDGTIITKAIGDLSNPAVGTYTYDHTFTKPGRHVYEYAGTAGTVAAGQSEIWARRKGAAA